MWAFATQIKTTPRELPGQISSYAEPGEKKGEISLDTVVAVFLQSPPLDLLATGKLHQAMKAPLDHRVGQAELFSFPRCLTAGRSELVSTP